jgi:hypothetical protein
MGTLSQSVEGITPKAALGPQWALQAVAYAPWLAPVSFYFILANIPYWIATGQFGLSPLGVFGIEYVAVGILSLIVPRFVTAALLFLLICADVLSGICLTYVLPLRQCFANLNSAHSFSRSRFVLALIVFVLALLASAAAVFVPGRKLTRPDRGKAAICLTTFAVLVLAVDFASVSFAAGHVPFLRRSDSSTDQLNLGAADILRFARVPIFRLVRLERFDAGVRAREAKGMGAQSPVPSAVGAALHASGVLSSADPAAAPNLVVVIVESWGLSNDAPIGQALVQPYLQPDVLAKYRVSQGTVPFYGATVAGEARELCGNTIGYYLIDAPASALGGCLPDRLAARGYWPIGIHGMSRFMFNRSSWYATIGFKEMWFHGGLKRAGLPDCVGAFIGTCDADVAAWIGHRLDSDSSRPLFIHWITLNSHLPVPVPARLGNAAPCDPSVGLSPGTALCSWYQLVANVHQSVVRMASGNLARPTVFVVVGDHSPPFADLRVHNSFSQSDVPYIVLVPNSISAAAPKNLLAQKSANSASGAFRGAASKPTRQIP